MISSKKMKVRKRIAVVAQESFKAELINWAYFNRKVLNQHDLIATGEMGNVLEGTTNTTVIKLASAPLGGYSQLGRMIKEGEIDIIIFFCNPFEIHIADGEVKSLHMIAEKNNIIIATNRGTADFVLSSPLMTTDHPIFEHDYAAYVKRKAAYCAN